MFIRSPRVRALLPWALVLLWMGLIFWFSAQSGDASYAQSDKLSGMLRWTTPYVDIRKVAHFFLFFVLGLLCFWGFRAAGRSPGRAALSALMVCAAYALLDECHQVFVPGRAMLLTDMLLDTAAAATGLVVCFAVARRRGAK